MVYERVLISRNELHESVTRLAGEISASYADRPFIALTLLEGARYFAEDLLSKIDGPFVQEFVKVSSYCGTTAVGTAAIGYHEELREKLHGKDVLVIDDIYDTGKTLFMLLQRLESFAPRSIKTCVLLEKEIDHCEDIAVDFLGMKVPNVFVIGYGMDYNDHYRELPFIAELASECIEE